MKKEYDVVIIGCGVAGMSTALYLQRSSINYLIIEANVVGGQLNKISKIENYPGFSLIDGPSLAFNMYEQINKHDNMLYDEVINILNKQNYFEIITKKEKTKCRYVVLATGRIPKRLNCQNMDKYLGKGVSYCALCDGNLFKNKNVIVFGNSINALNEAIYLSNICNQVTIVNKKERFDASIDLIKKVDDIKNIKTIYNNNIIELSGNDVLKSVTLKDNVEIKCDGLFINIGYAPGNSFIESIKSENNYIIVDENYETNIPNVFACGDIIKKSTYQIITACYDGVMVACQIIKKNKQQ